MWTKQPKSTEYSQNIDKSPEKKFKKSFYLYILRWTGFLIPLTSLYYKYIDRPILTEQKTYLIT